MKCSNFGLAAALVAASFLPMVAKAQTVSLAGGETQVVLASSFVSALGSLGVTPGSVGLAHLYKGVATFPITVGLANLSQPKAEIGHLGGLSLTAGKTVVNLLNFEIEVVDSTPVITGIVTVNGSIVDRLPLFNITGIGNIYQPYKEALSIQGVTLTLTSGAATALNGVFGTTALTGGFNIGTASTYTFLFGEACK